MKKKNIRINSVSFAYFLGILLIAFSSCSTLKESAVLDNQTSLNVDNLSMIDGCYERFPMDSLWGNNARDLHRLFSLKFLDYGYENDYVRLKVIDENHIKYELMDKTSVVYSKVLKGKLVNGEFEFRRRAKILPIIVATIYLDSKVRLGLLENGNLIVDAKCMDYGLVYFILPTFPVIEKRYDQEFEKLKNYN